MESNNNYEYYGAIPHESEWTKPTRLQLLSQNPHSITQNLNSLNVNTYEEIAKIVFKTQNPTKEQIRQTKSAYWSRNYVGD